MSVQAISRRFNLGRNDWAPLSVPEPEQTVIAIDCNGMKPCQVAAETILKTYNVQDDWARLKTNPETFEKQRGDYPLRREFHIWKVQLHNASPEIISIVKELGFQVL